VNRNVRIGIIFVVIVAMLSGSFWVGAGGFSRKSDTVATVGGEKITKDELYEQMVEQYGKQSLDALVSAKILELEAKKNGVKVEASEIDAEIAKFQEMYGGGEGLENALASNGLTMSYLRNNIESNIKIKKILEPTIEITDDEIATYFEANKASFGQEEQVNASHILVETEEIANEVKQRLDAGEEFAALAKEFSIDASNSQNGGSLGNFGKGAMVPAFEEAAFGAEVGDVVGPVETQFGFHLIMVNDKIEAVPATLEANKIEVRDTILDQKISSQINTWLDEKYEEYEIELLI
jgi:foldase protein PrsA